jgi:hypothetical protein
VLLVRWGEIDFTDTFMRGWIPDLAAVIEGR